MLLREGPLRIFPEAVLSDGEHASDIGLKSKENRSFWLFSDTKLG